MPENVPLTETEKCENCGSPNVAHYDVEGVPICERCWNDPLVEIEAIRNRCDAVKGSRSSSGAIAALEHERARLLHLYDASRERDRVLKAICETLIAVAKHCQYDDCGEGRYLHVHIPADHMADWGALVKAVRDD